MAAAPALLGAALAVALTVPPTSARQGPGAPSVSTGDATNVTLRTADVSGSVNPNGSETTYRFRYGRTKRYGRTTPAVSAGAGITPVEVTEHLSGLRFATRYHYRLVAQNDQGRTLGADRVLRTHEPVIHGPYRVRVRIVSGGDPFGQHRGLKARRKYRLTPRRCNETRCKVVKLRREGKRGRFRSALHHTGPAAFRGRDPFRGWCDDGLRFRSRSLMRLRATRARETRASRLRGSLRLEASGCVDGRERAKLRGRAL